MFNKKWKHKNKIKKESEKVRAREQVLSQRGQECRWNEEEACACVSKAENDLGKERAEILQGLRADIKCLPVTKRGGEERRNGCGLQEWAEKQSLQHELRTQLNNTTFMKTAHTHPHIHTYTPAGRNPGFHVSGISVVVFSYHKPQVTQSNQCRNELMEEFGVTVKLICVGYYT